jgi:hypothetical protein
MKALSILTLAIVVSATEGCADEAESSTSPPPAQTSTPPPNGFDNAPTKTPVASCTDAAKLVYVVSRYGELHSFAPDKLTFTKIGRMNCPSGLPNSMAIDREGTAWVSFKNGKLGKVRTSDAVCSETAFVPNQQGFDKFGMAFTAASGATEKLYIAGIATASRDAIDGKGLGTIDLDTLAVSPIGDYSGDLARRAAELTGTGDGKLYGFFFTSPSATLAQIDPVTGSTQNPRVLSGIDVGKAFAFSFWGGDFWFYTSEGVPPDELPSKVTRLDTRSNAISVVIPNAGFSIVGAGVSICAPLTQPN